MKTVIEMAREAGLFTHKEVQPELERFAALVRADEREACAKVCDVTVLGDEYLTAAINACADTIRARKQA